MQKFREGCQNKIDIKAVSIIHTQTIYHLDICLFMKLTSRPAEENGEADIQTQ